MKIQFIGKVESKIYNVKYNSHWKDAKTFYSILASKHFQHQRHDFNKHQNFIIIDPSSKSQLL